jgi:hypothetical protein
MLYRIRFQYGLVVRASCQEEAVRLVEDKMRKSPNVFISSVESATTSKKTLGGLLKMLVFG